MRSSLGCVVGLASRTELTMLDEPTTGLDAVARQTFYEAVIDGIGREPRTLVLSTHLIDEVAPLVERAVVMHQGIVVTDGEVDDLRVSMLTLSGPTDVVLAYAEGRDIVHRETLGPTTRAIVGPGNRALDPVEAAAMGLDVEHPTLQEIIVRSVGRAGSTDRPKLEPVGSPTGGDR